MDAVQFYEFTIFITEIAEDGFFSIGLIDDWQWSRIGFVAFRYTTSIYVCLFTNHIRSNIYLLSLSFKYANSHTIYE